MDPNSLGHFGYFSTARAGTEHRSGAGTERAPLPVSVDNEGAPVVQN